MRYNRIRGSFLQKFEIKGVFLQEAQLLKIIYEGFLMNKTIQKIADKLAQLEEVECVMLAGSQTDGTVDDESDYDLYVYTNKELSVERRKEVLDEFLIYCEYNNTFWETEDDGILKDTTETVELIYRNFDFIESEYQRLFTKFTAYTGYSTCIWSNIAKSHVLFDRNGKGSEYISRFKSQKYPVDLKNNIILKNIPLLIGTIPSYYGQIEKAIIRNDLVSVNHRVAAFLASYFDILLAINELPHPGEKKLLKFVGKNCSIVPENWKKDIKNILKYAADPGDRLLKSLYKSFKKLNKLVKK